MKNKNYLIVGFTILVLIGAYFGYSAYQLDTSKWLLGPVGMVDKEWRGAMMTIAEYEKYVNETLRPLEKMYGRTGVLTGGSEKKLKAAKQKRDTYYMIGFSLSIIGLYGLAHSIIQKRELHNELKNIES